jgi:SAM-dependent methyltransferase
MNSAVDYARLQMAVLADAGCPPPPNASVLDLGCGNGSIVRGWMDCGFDAFGCDLKFKSGLEVENLEREGRIRLIEFTPYRLPFPDASFDVVFTNQVMEHVRDYPATLKEIRRIMKPDGRLLNIFPARLRPIEPHVRVPLATVMQSKAWLSLWALLGVRTAAQKGTNWRKVAAENHGYLQSSTNYLNGPALRRQFSRFFGEVRYVEGSYLKLSPNARGRYLHRLAVKLPFLFALYRVVWTRFLLVRP